MTGRELLELAARAAGYPFNWRGLNGTLPSIFLGRDQRWWNPLADDGDALRLALKLGIQIGDPHQYPDLALACTNGRLPWAEYWEPIKDGDYCAATRRAIVRAAAEIGKQL